MKKLILILGIILLSSASLLATTADSTKHLQSLPSVTLKDMNGNNVNISELSKHGGLTVISFWATWCKPCIKELKNMDALYEEWQEKYNVKVVAVSIDDSRNTIKVKPFVNSQGWSYDVLLDPNGDLQRPLNVTNPPVTFLLNKDGQIVYTHTGYLEGDEFELEEQMAKLIR